MAFMGMASLGKMTFLKEHGLRSKAHQLMEHHVLPWAPNTFKYLGQKPCVGRICRAEFPAIRLHHKPWLKKSAHAQRCSCKYVQYIHTTILICIHGIIHISHIVNYKYIYIYIWRFPNMGVPGYPAIQWGRHSAAGDLSRPSEPRC